ncbi:hypothetical protein EW146_g10168 [Bondarzewia mesenterica]|uniref:ATP-dependent DNA helicase n=1 Tax=Bondarzewia mesenterica TaxID=1095465 RepID=A0A4V3XC49_9AGAM|nr:hypothetical protein EW146_g10168 [Bondarzewia mesenterica]
MTNIEDDAVDAGVQEHMSNESTNIVDGNERTVPSSSETVDATEDVEQMVTLAADESGMLYTKSQVVDYQFRGHALESSNLIDFLVNTYEADIKKDEHRHQNVQPTTTQKRRGRPLNDRVLYLPQHPKHRSVVRILRSIGHNTLPNLIGFHLIPRSDDSEKHAYYSACMLILLKPWRKLEQDLKTSNETWEAAFNQFVMNACAATKRRMEGFQYFHECASAAQKKAHVDNQKRTTVEDDSDLEEDDDAGTEEIMTEEGLAALMDDQTNPREKVYAHVALSHAVRAGIFSNHGNPEVFVGDELSTGGVVNATESHIQSLHRWRDEMSKDIADRNETNNGRPNRYETSLSMNEDGQPSVTPLSASSFHSQNLDWDAVHGVEEALSPLAQSELKQDQKRAYDIISWHLRQTLTGKRPPPLRMIIHGEGGTGKSKVIQTVTELFAQVGARGMLAKAAYTGVAASLIEGKTTHVLCAISPKRTEKISDAARKQLQADWCTREYLIVDEYSMIGKSFLAKLSKHVSIAKQDDSNQAIQQSFGGISVILCGDHHQFPPVAQSKREALYWPLYVAGDTIDMQIGRTIFEEFDIVVVLSEQMRVKDARWNSFLHNLRMGQVEQDDIDMLRRQVLVNENCAPTDFRPILGTTYHLLPHDTHRFICNAEDRIKDHEDRPLTIEERYAIAKSTAKTNVNGNKNLSNVVEFAIGMKIMVTTNLSTEIDITNGARGEITQIVLHPNEPTPRNESVIHLRHLPLYILAKMQRTRAATLSSLDAQVIPIEPSIQTWRINAHAAERKPVTNQIRRRQFPITAAYAFTDYRAQGQTIPYVLVDIAPPPTGKLSLLNLYVALSRSSGRDSIRLLRDFDERLFMAAHESPVLEEDERLTNKNEATKKWWNELQTVL